MKKVLFATYVRGAIQASMILALPCAILISGSALAAPPGEYAGLEEIVVTAEKRESTVQATPIAMTALSAGDLTGENITSIQDLVGAIPGISLRTAGPGQTEYEMRGLASSGGSVATVGFYIDETPLSASAVALNGRTVIDADLSTSIARRSCVGRRAPCTAPDRWAAPSSWSPIHPSSMPWKGLPMSTPPRPPAAAPTAAAA